MKNKLFFAPLLLLCSCDFKGKEDYVRQVTSLNKDLMECRLTANHAAIDLTEVCTTQLKQCREECPKTE
jgi:hypothetical protein